MKSVSESQNTDIQLVITVALKKELPLEWLKSKHIPVNTMAALKSGALKELKKSDPGIMVLITGPGLEASSEAACWIRDNLAPLYVLNIGTCGLINNKHSPGSWIIPEYAVNADRDKVKIDTRLPLPSPDKALKIDTLLSLEKPLSDSIPDSWKHYDAVDMESWSQARIFSTTKISYHCLKFSTDFSDSNTITDFNINLKLFRDELRSLLSFINPSPAHNTRISAIIPVYNRENKIRRAIDSVLSQSLLPDEIIVVDDGSTDNTRTVLESYGKHIKCIYLSENAGPSKARNEGARDARNEWIAFLDSDDQWEKHKIKNQLSFLRKYPFYQIIQSDEKWIRNGVRVNPRNHHQKPAGWIWERALERCLVSPSGVFLKKSLFEKYGGFNESLPACEDYDLWLKISRDHPVGLELSLSIIKYGGHKDQLSHKYPAMDSFRVEVLSGVLGKEEDSLYKEKIFLTLQKKLNILINGSEKRGKIKEAEKYREMLKLHTMQL